MIEISKETIEKTMEALRKNRMTPYFCQTKEEAKAKVQELMQEIYRKLYRKRRVLERYALIEVMILLFEHFKL